jgi:hypothetical protein
LYCSWAVVLVIFILRLGPQLALMMTPEEDASTTSDESDSWEDNTINNTTDGGEETFLSFRHSLLQQDSSLVSLGDDAMTRDEQLQCLRAAAIATEKSDRESLALTTSTSRTDMVSSSSRRSLRHLGKTKSGSRVSFRS